MESTVPFVCRSGTVPSYYPCQMKVQASISDRYWWYTRFQDVVARDECGTTFTPGNSVGMHMVYLKAKRDFFNDGDGYILLEFPRIRTSYSRIWNNYKIPDIVQVRTHDRDRPVRKCCSSGDPHLTSFDNTYFHVYSPGEFIFYKHKYLPYEIQTRLTRCGSVACNCGIAVRAGDDIIIIDKCQSVSILTVYYRWGRQYYYYRRYSILNIEVKAIGQMTPGFKLIRMYSGTMYKIHLPTGAYVEVYTYQYSSYINICFSPAADDYGWIGGGLCGSYDNDDGNDFLHGPFGASTNIYSNTRPTYYSYWGSIPTAFSDSWRWVHRLYL
ncbi:von Willebrand factor D and EGF domain-containing protein-like [Saccoglossus kowalevskii]